MNYIADLHTHTLASAHAYSTIIENCQAAAKKGIKLIAKTEHAPMMPDSAHIWHIENQHLLPDFIEGVRVLKSVEANICNSDGELDINDHILSKLEWVVASIHFGIGFWTESPKELYDTYKNVCQNIHVDLIGHPTATDIDFDAEAFAKLFKEYDKLVELNEASFFYGRTKRDKLIDLIKACKKYETPVAVDSDAHFCYAIGDVSNVEKLLEELDFPSELVINSDYEKLKERILKKRPWIKL